MFPLAEVKKVYVFPHGYSAETSLSLGRLSSPISDPSGIVGGSLKELSAQSSETSSLFLAFIAIVVNNCFSSSVKEIQGMLLDGAFAGGVFGLAFFVGVRNKKEVTNTASVIYTKFIILLLSCVGVTLFES